MDLKESMILGIGNPLLDIIATVNEEFLKKHNLKANSAILGDHVKISKICKELKQYKIDYIAGGSAQNTLRTAAWILKQPNVVTFMGCIGDDENAKIMIKKAKEVGLKTLFQIDSNEPTGTCAVLVNEKNRSLVSNLAASYNFSLSYLNENWSYVKQSKLIYIVGFFITISTEIIQRISTFALKNNKILALNLSATYLSENEKYRKVLLNTMPYVDILFGNDDEAKAFAKHALRLETTNLNEIVIAIANIQKLGEKKRIVVITQGHNDILYTDEYDSSIVKQISVPKIDSDKIIDTNGAGDVFVGGFLSQFVQNKSLEKSIDCGIWSSSLIIQQSGCSFPEQMNYK